MAWKKHPYKGRMLTIPEAARLTGIPQNTLYDRVNRRGYTLEYAIEMPECKYLPAYEYHGERLTKAEIAEKAGVQISAISAAMHRYGISVAEAADYLAALNKEVEYNGRRMTLAKFAKSTHKPAYRMYIMVEQMGMSPDEAINSTSKVPGRMTPEKAARAICVNIFSSSTPEEVDFAEGPDGSFSFGSELYRYDVRFLTPKRAVLTAIFRDDKRGDHPSSAWEYSVSNIAVKYKGRIKVWS